MDYLDKHGIEPADALHQFFDFLGSDVLLVANNNRFDLKMLQQECAKFDCAFESDAGIEKVNPFSPSTPCTRFRGLLSNAAQQKSGNITKRPQRPQFRANENMMFLKY